MSIRFTYETVTPESAEYDDYASAGFYEMKQLTPNEAYDRYVGMITVDQFLAPFGGDIDQAIDQAIDQLMTEQWWITDGSSHPDNLPELIKDYVIKRLCD